MRSVMIASSKRHAEAMIAWLKLKTEEWEAIAYGDKINQTFSHAKLIRPSEGLQQEHVDWILEKLIPNLRLTVTTVPKNWHIPQNQVA